MTHISYLADDNGNRLMDLAGNDWFAVEEWDLRGPRPGEVTLRESLPLVGLFNLEEARFQITELEKVLDLAARNARAPRPDELIWWYFGTPGEMAKRALVYSGLVSAPAYGRMRSGMMRGGAAEILLEMTRGAYWESAALDAFATSGLNYTLGTVLPITPGGTADGRVDLLRVTGLSAGPNTRLWAGFREMGYGIDDFKPIWDLYDGTNYGGAFGSTTRISDANGWGGHTVAADHGTLNSRNLRIQLSLDDIVGAGDARHMVGRYLLLLRWSGTNNSVFAITAAQRTANTVFFPPLFHEKQFVTGAGTGTYDLLPLAVVDLPQLAGARGEWTAAQLAQSLVEIHTEMLSGTAGDVLRLNTITAVPVSRSLRANEVYTDGVYQARISCLPSELWTGWNASAATTFPGGGVELAASNFYAPPEGGVLVAALARQTSHVAADQMVLQLDLARRWRTYRSDAGRR
jgi:hypothetical protein